MREVAVSVTVVMDDMLLVVTAVASFGIDVLVDCFHPVQRR